MTNGYSFDRSYAAAQAYTGPAAEGVSCYTYPAPVAPRGFGGGFALIVVAFILLIIIGASIVY